MNVDVEMDSVSQEINLLLTTYGLDVVGAIVILVIGWILASWAAKVARVTADRANWMDATLKPLAASVVRYFVLTVTIIAVLNQFGVETTSVIAVLGAAGLAIGLALQGTLSNVAAGVMILVLRPFKVGDFVEAGGEAGTIKEVGLFATELATGDNVFISVPNRAIIGGAITNFSRHGTRRIDIIVGIGYSADIDQAFDVLRGLAEADDRVLKEPEVHVSVRELADSSVNLGLRFWVNAADYWNVLFDLNKGLKQGLDAAGIEIPFPQRVVEIKNAEPVAKPVQRRRKSTSGAAGA
jgi:small conductance mechanosensitive channel